MFGTRGLSFEQFVVNFMTDFALWRKTALALAIGGVGALIAFWINLPAPALTGPSIAVTLAGLLGLDLAFETRVRDVSFLVIGLSMGTSVTPEVYQTAKQWPLSLIAVVLAVTLGFFLSQFVLKRFWKYDAKTAVLGASPGHLSFVIGLGVDSGADIRLVAIVQSIRVLALTLVVPMLVVWSGLAANGFVVPTTFMDLRWVAFSLAMAALVGLAFKKFRVPAAFVLAGMIVSLISHLSGLVSGHMPQWLTLPALTILGSMIGTRFSGVSLAELRKAFGAGMAITLVGVFAAILFAVLLAQLIDLPIAQLVVAFAPGGVEAMAAMAFALNLDPTFVATHHIARLFYLSFFMPFALMWWGKD
jgi:membrane AbrB-like protein